MPADPSLFLQQQQQRQQEVVQVANPRVSPRRGLGEVGFMRRDVAGMAAQVREDVGVEARKLEMELQVSRMQQTLGAVNRHLEAEQRKGEIERESAAVDREGLLDQIKEKDDEIATGNTERCQLEGEITTLKGEIEAQLRNFAEEKKVLNEHFLRVGQEHHQTVEKLQEAEAEHKTLIEQNTVLQDWLNRGTEECKRASDENETTKKILEQTAGNWEEDHKTLTDKLSNLETQYKIATHERGALAVNLTAARSRVIDDSRNLYNLSPILKDITKRCIVIESALSSSCADPLAGMMTSQDLRNPPDFQQSDMLPPGSSHHVRSAVSELHVAFAGIHETARVVLRRWQDDRELAHGLPDKIQDAQTEAKALKDSNDRLKLKLNELRGELEKWRQKAAILESAKGTSGMPMSRLEKQQLLQAQTVAATLHREKEMLAKTVKNLESENNSLRDNYNTTEAENKIMQGEIQRLRGQVARHASQFDAFKPLPSLH